MERLTMRDITEIIYRLRKGQSERAIARDLNNHRITVHQYRLYGCEYVGRPAAVQPVNARAVYLESQSVSAIAVSEVLSALSKIG